MNPLVNITIGYATVLLIGFIGLTFLTAGFLPIFLQVKMSRGKKVLVQVRSTTRDYFRPGEVIEGFLVYKFKKEWKRVALPPDAIFRTLGVLAVQVDEEKNAVAKVDFSAVRGFDAVKWDNLLKRALYRPSILDQKQQLMLILLFVIIGGLLLIGFLLYKVNGNLETLVVAKNAAAVI
jgi:hypothetical protein